MSIIGGFVALLLDKNSEIAKQRKAICKGCHVSEYGGSRFCKVKHNGCGCLWSVKARDPEESCPIEKWLAIKE